MVVVLGVSADDERRRKNTGCIYIQIEMRQERKKEMMDRSMSNGRPCPGRWAC